MKIVLCYLYGPQNAGDMALNLGAIDILQSTGEVDLAGISRFSAGNANYLAASRYLKEMYPSMSINPFPINYDRGTQSGFGRLLAFAGGSLLYLPTTRYSLLRHTRLTEVIDSADFVVFNGGNLLFARRSVDYLRLMGVLYPLAYARAVGKPYGFLPQSIASATSRIGRHVIESYMRSAQFFLFRESASSQIWPWQQNKETWPDLAFFIQSFNEEGADRILSENGLQRGGFVPIVLRSTSLGDQGSLGSEDVNCTVQFAIHACERIASEGLQPVFVVQTTRDKQVSERSSSSLCRLGVPVVEETDPLILKAFYRHAHAVITFRLHAAVFAISEGTPTLGIYREEWGPKMPGIFRDLGLADFCRVFSKADELGLSNLVKPPTNLEERLASTQYELSKKRMQLVNHLRSLMYLN